MTYRVSALNPATGAVVWWRPVATAANISYENGRLLILDDRQLIAVDAATGSTLWLYQWTNSSGTKGPLAIGNRVYVNQWSTLYAFDAENGTQLWIAQHATREPTGRRRAPHLPRA